MLSVMKCWLLSVRNHLSTVPIIERPRGLRGKGKYTAGNGDTQISQISRGSAVTSLSFADVLVNIFTR